MDHEEAIRRSIPFLQELERKLGLPVTNAAPSSPSLNARQNKLPNNPPETHGAPPIKAPQKTKLRLPKARRKGPSPSRPAKRSISNRRHRD
jgi:hypothetical protein